MRLSLVFCVIYLGAPLACGSRGDLEEDDLHETMDGDVLEVSSSDSEWVDDLIEARECENSADCEGHFGRLDQCEVAACNTDSGRCAKLAATNGLSCIDRDFCTTADRCIDGRCVGGPPLDCDDDNPCTFDRCEPRQGCVREFFEGRCDDDNACTVRDTCAEGRCRGERRDCDDGDSCTEDGCDRAKGCTFRSLPECR